MKRTEDRPVRVVQIGIGGMGFHYLKTLLTGFPPGKVNLSGVVDPYPERSELYDEVKKRGVSVCSSFKEFLDLGLTADLVVISSPLQHHVSQSLEALGAGSHVLCEKPLAATIQEADRLIHDTRLDSHWMRIGYQWSYTAAVQELKKDIMRGDSGSLFGPNRCICGQEIPPITAGTIGRAELRTVRIIGFWTARPTAPWLMTCITCCFFWEGVLTGLLYLLKLRQRFIKPIRSKTTILWPAVFY